MRVLLIALLAAISYAQTAIELLGVFSIDLSGTEHPNTAGKAVQIRATSSVDDLSLYGLGTANNGLGTDGKEITFPSVSLEEGDVRWLVRDSVGFLSYMEDCLDGTNIIEVGSALNQNGNDAIELFFNDEVVETYGDINQDGSGTDWDYKDSWAYKGQGTWYTGGVGCSSGASSNSNSSCPYPFCLPHGRGSLRIGVGGDCLFEDNLQIQAFRAESYQTMWEGIEPLLQRPDITYINFEGTAANTIDNTFSYAPDPGMVYEFGGVYSSGGPNLLFNYHPMAAQNFRDSGVDIVSTSNNHVMDRGSPGINQTIDALRMAGLEYCGTRKNTHEPWHRITNKKGWKIAWICCTMSTNFRVNNQTDHRDMILDCLYEEFLEKITSLSQDPTIDAVMGVIHWGW